MTDFSDLLARLQQIGVSEKKKVSIPRLSAVFVLSFPSFFNLNLGGFCF